jgi:hypothetical protein
MPSSFFALPLANKGESFFLQTADGLDDYNVLVDAGDTVGNSNNRLCGVLISASTGINTVHRFICTHQDADHCGGAPDFLDDCAKSNIDVEQVWLPALWSVTTAAGPNLQSTILLGALQAVAEIGRIESEPTKERDGNCTSDAVEAIKTLAHQRRLFDGLFHPSGPDAAIPLNLPQIAHATTEEVATIPELGEHQWLQALSLAWSAVDTYGRLNRIVIACQRHNIPVRWFDFGLFEQTDTPSGGDVGLLTPVNAVEVAPQPVVLSPLQLFVALTLTRQNVESLVFLRHEAPNEPAALFTADSRLAFGISRPGRSFRQPVSGLPSRSPLLVTAMHHASATNDHGYGVLASWLSPNTHPYFVRNGGRIHRISQLFLSQQRCCVRCHNSTRKEQLIHISSANGQWQLPAKAKNCICR